MDVVLDRLRRQIQLRSNFLVGKAGADELHKLLRTTTESELEFAIRILVWSRPHEPGDLHGRERRHARSGATNEPDWDQACETGQLSRPLLGP